MMTRVAPLRPFAHICGDTASGSQREGLSPSDRDTTFQTFVRESRRKLSLGPNVDYFRLVRRIPGSPGRN